MLCGVAGAMEKGQLAVQRETHLGCWTGARPLPEGEVGCESLSCGCSSAQVSGTEEHHNNGYGDGAARIKVSQEGLDWPHKGELFLAQWAHDASGKQCFMAR